VHIHLTAEGFEVEGLLRGVLRDLRHIEKV
jgi:hypothetical protein